MRLTPEQRAEFGRWLLKCGAEVLPPVGEWEIFRVIANGITYSAYARKTGFQNWPTPLQLLYTQFRDGATVPKLGTVDGPKKALSGNRRGRIAKIAERDGWSCWYCRHPLQPIGYADDPARRGATLEEVCPRQIGGPTHIGNQVIACGLCNAEAANFSVAEKVRMRDRKLAGRIRALPIMRMDTPRSPLAAPNANGSPGEPGLPKLETQILTRENAADTS